VLLKALAAIFPLAIKFCKRVEATTLQAAIKWKRNDSYEGLGLFNV
jgi:hypothetical protein